MKELEIRKDEGSRQMIHGARRSKANMDQFGASSWHVEALVSSFSKGSALPWFNRVATPPNRRQISDSFFDSSSMF